MLEPYVTCDFDGIKFYVDGYYFDMTNGVLFKVLDDTFITLLENIPPPVGGDTVKLAREPLGGCVLLTVSYNGTIVKHVVDRVTRLVDWRRK